MDVIANLKSLFFNHHLLLRVDLSDAQLTRLLLFGVFSLSWFLKTILLRVLRRMLDILALSSLLRDLDIIPIDIDEKIIMSINGKMASMIK